MALVKRTLTLQLNNIFQEFRKRTEVDDMALADALASAIDTYIRSAEVKPGIPVTTSAGSGTTSGPGTLM